MTTDNVRAYYNAASIAEWERLVKDAYHGLELRACEGLSSNLPDATNALAKHRDSRWERWLRILDQTQRDPAVVALSEHFLYVGRAPAG